MTKKKGTAKARAVGQIGPGPMSKLEAAGLLIVDKDEYETMQTKLRQDYQEGIIANTKRQAGWYLDRAVAAEVQVQELKREIKGWRDKSLLLEQHATQRTAEKEQAESALQNLMAAVGTWATAVEQMNGIVEAETALFVAYKILLGVNNQ